MPESIYICFMLMCLSQWGSAGHPQHVCRTAGSGPHVFSSERRGDVLQLGEQRLVSVLVFLFRDCVAVMCPC